MHRQRRNGLHGDRPARPVTRIRSVHADVGRYTQGHRDGDGRRRDHFRLQRDLSGRRHRRRRCRRADDQRHDLRDPRSTGNTLSGHATATWTGLRPGTITDAGCCDSSGTELRGHCDATSSTYTTAPRTTATRSRSWRRRHYGRRRTVLAADDDSDRRTTADVLNNPPTISGTPSRGRRSPPRLALEQQSDLLRVPVAGLRQHRTWLHGDPGGDAVRRTRSPPAMWAARSS